MSVTTGAIVEPLNGTIPPGPQAGPEGAASVIKAIVGVTKRVHEVPKSGYNEKDKYSFVTAADLNTALQGALAAEGLVLPQREVDRKIVNKILMIKYEFDAWHVSGERIVGIASHTGSCRFEFKSGATDDKAASKCYVSASKYMALGLFKIPTDDATVERLSDGDADSQGIHDDAPPDAPNGGYRQDRVRDDRRQTDRSEDRRRDDPPEDRRRDDRVQDQPRNFADDPPFDEPPPDWGNPPPPDIDERGPPDIPYDRGTVTPPAQSPDEVSFRNRLMGMMADLKGAMDEETAARIWTDEKNAQLLRSASDVTYEHFRMAYFDRHKAYPPAT